MEPTLTDWIIASASVLTLIVAGIAVRLAAKAPEAAAKFAEEYRRQNAAQDELQQFRMQVFRALMKGRAEMLHHDTRAAINLVEVAFADDHNVRAARRMFTQAVRADPCEDALIVQRYLNLVEAVAVAIGFGDKIDRFDIESGYYPKAMGLLDEAALTEAAAKIGRHNGS